MKVAIDTVHWDHRSPKLASSRACVPLELGPYKLARELQLFFFFFFFFHFAPNGCNYCSLNRDARPNRAQRRLGIVSRGYA